MSSAPSVTGISVRAPSAGGRPGPVDLLVAIVAGILTTALVHLDPEEGSRTPDALGYGLGVAAAIAVAFHRIRPAATFGVVMAIQLVYHLVGYPGAGPFPALMVAMFGLAAAGRRRSAIAAAVVVAATALVVQVVRDGADLFSPTIMRRGGRSFGKRRPGPRLGRRSESSRPGQRLLTGRDPWDGRRGGHRGGHQPG